MSTYEQLHSIKEIDSFLKENTLSFLYISRPDCSVCHGLWPQIENMLHHYPDIQLARIDADEVTEVAGRFSIFTVPVLLLFVDGKEHIRKARIVHLDELDKGIARLLDAFRS